MTSGSAGLRASARVLAAAAAVAVLGCSSPVPPVLTISGSVVGREGDVLRLQLDRFRARHPGLTVDVRVTPDAADQRHQLYVQWLNAHVSEPDVLQLDVIWTPEFAAAGWIDALDRFTPDVSDFFSAPLAANRWRGTLYALPWFVDVGMLYWRTDLLADPPRTLDALVRDAVALQKGAPGGGSPPRPAFGLVWQGARYEGLVTVFSEFLAAFGGAIMDDTGRVTVDSEAGVRALTFMRDSLYDTGIVPDAALGWQEEQTRFAFQNGQALFMRNWPYAYALVSDPGSSAVAGHVSVAPMPAGEGGHPAAALGGSSLALNAFSDQKRDAYALMAFLLEPQQMVERAAIAGELPPRRTLYDSRALADATALPVADVRPIIDAAVPRPATPVYSQLSSILQVALHRALTRQQEPRQALADAAVEMRRLLDRLELPPQ